MNARARWDVENPAEDNASEEETDEDLEIYVKNKPKQRFEADEREEIEEGKCCTWCCC